ncbi:MAG: SLBB domain-containing protein [Bacteroidia bacterium]|jgi:protein involved in polysaccharide export with SLBB domain|nr:SLBB domain-containing protein [Bacteroidia bacterium]
MKQLSHLLVALLLWSSIQVWAQGPIVSLQNFEQTQVDNLTDEQLQELMRQAKQRGLTIADIEKLAKDKRMPVAEINKLTKRLSTLSTSPAGQNRPEATPSERKPTDQPTTNGKPKVEGSPIFGADLFTNDKLTFEPNLRIATPANYQLGPDDELVIDIFGFSEATYTVKVTPDGYVRIPNVGPVQVSGNTIEQAKKKIVRSLGAIYAGISSGQTSVNVTLGNIRSIKVTLLGEVNTPGTYTLSSLATVFNALYASGGPNQNGSFRNIQVIRSGKLVSTVDVYELLLNGNTKSNIRLQDQDVIKVSPYQVRVELKGEVKRPGLYEMTSKETLKDLINFAGGFSNNAYRDRIKIIRNTGKEKSVADVPAEMFSFFTAQAGDEFTVGKTLDRFANRVEIRGAVFRPGIFALEDGLTVGKLIQKAEGIKEDAFLSRAIIYRIKEDNTAEVISFDVSEVLKGKDIPLKREDMVEINSKLALKEDYNLTIGGAVLKPGSYPFAENARVEDLIIAAGGMRENADVNKIEVARRVKNDSVSAGMNSTQVFTYVVQRDLKTQSSFTLMPYDVVTVYTLPGYQPQRKALLEGEVYHPGEYALSSNGERISDVIKRSGGVTENGYVQGASLIRIRKKDRVEELIRKQKKEALQKQTDDTTRIELLEANIDESVSMVGIDLEKIMKNPGSKYDLLLEDGDVIRIPRLLQTVKVSGEVLYPVRIRYEGKRMKRYINGAGGYSNKALKRGIYVVYANGSADATSKFLFFRNHPKVLPGCEVIVPPKDERKKLSAVETVTILTSLVTIAVLITSLYR